MPSERADVMAGWGCMVIVMGGGGFGFYLAAGWLAGLFGPNAEHIGRWIGALAAIALFVSLAVSYGRYVGRKSKRRSAATARDEVVEELRVHSDRAVAIEGDHSSIDHGVCIDIGQGKLLLLVGKWLRDAKRLGIDGTNASTDDEGDNYLNGLPPPVAFPATEFTLRRLRATGDVLSMRVQGTYVIPRGQPYPLSAADFEDLPESAVLEGEIGDLASAMRRSSPEIHRRS